MKALASIGLPAWLARLSALRRGDGSEPSGAIPVRDWIHVSTAAPARLTGFDQGLACVVLALLALGTGMVFSASIPMPANPKFAR